MNKNKKILILVISMLLLVGCGSIDLNKSAKKQIDKTSAYILQEVQEPTVSSIGGEWTIIGLEKSGANVPDDYYDKYYDNVRVKMKTTKGDFAKQSTDYARVILALTAIGKDPKDVEGYDLTKSLDDCKGFISQGVNGSTYALIAANEANIKLENEKKYIDNILENVTKDGGFSFGGKEADADMTAIVLQGLSYYKDQEEVKKVIESGIKVLERNQKQDGSMGTCEATCQAIIATEKLDITIKKNDKTLFDGLGEYIKDDGFVHEKGDEKVSLMSTEQSLIALSYIK